MTTEEELRQLRDEIRSTQECAETTVQMLRGIEHALVGSVGSKEPGLREQVNNLNQTAMDNRNRIAALEKADHACRLMTKEDVEKIKAMPDAKEIRGGITTGEKILYLITTLLAIAGVVIHFLPKK